MKKRKIIFTVVLLVFLGVLFSPTIFKPSKDQILGGGLKSVGLTLVPSGGGNRAYAYEDALVLPAGKTFFLNLEYSCKIPGTFLGIEVLDEKGIVDYYESNGTSSRWHKDGQSRIFLPLGPTAFPDFCLSLHSYNFAFENDGNVTIRIYATDKFDPKCIEVNATELVFRP